MKSVSTRKLGNVQCLSWESWSCHLSHRSCRDISSTFFIFRFFRMLGTASDFQITSAQLTRWHNHIVVMTKWSFLTRKSSWSAEVRSIELMLKVANLVFLKPDFEILAFFNALFCENQRKQTKSGFFWLFSVGKAWLWQSIVYLCLTMQDPKNVAKILLLP